MPYANKEDEKKWYQANRERIIAKARAWELSHPQETAKKKKEYIERHPERRKESNAKWARKPEVKAAQVTRRKESEKQRAMEKRIRERYRDTLADCFVRRILAQRMVIKGSELPQTLVDAHRELMRLKRAINEKL